MPIESKHPCLEEMAPVWKRARDVIGGSDSVKAASIAYIPKLDSMNEVEYKAYLTRGQFFNATARTLEGLTGMIFSKDPTITNKGAGRAGAGSAMESLIKDADMRATGIQDYAKDVISEVIAVGRAGTLIDWNDQENRPYFCQYSAENIANWGTARINGKIMLSMLVLAETVCLPEPYEEAKPIRGKKKATANDNDPYEEEEVEQLRSFRLLPLALQEGAAPPKPGKENFQCVIEIWQKVSEVKGAAKKWKLIQTLLPTRTGVPLPFIPFVFHGPAHSRPDCAKPPLDDLINVNLDHYRLDTDYKHGLHYTALPTAWVAGFPKDAELRIGSCTAWVSEIPTAQAGYLEFVGQGLGSYEKALERDEHLMAILGARLLEDQKKAAETAESLKIRQSGDHSMLMKITTSVSQSLSSVLKIAFWWASTEENPEAIKDEVISLSLNREFITAKMSGDEALAYVKSWIAGGFSQATLLHQLRRGDIIPPGVTDEEEIARIEQGKPSFPAPPAGNPGLPPRRAK
jgi:hypothetical protein